MARITVIVFATARWSEPEWSTYLNAGGRTWRFNGHNWVEVLRNWTGMDLD